MVRDDRELMAYVDAEAKAACELKGWGYQLRRKWSVRHKPVPESSLDDFEWKLLPDARGKQPDVATRDFDGVYYVLSFDGTKDRFVLQHDTSHEGEAGPHWEVATYSELGPVRLRTPEMGRTLRSDAGLPPVGWLRAHLLRLTSRFGPNSFSIT